MKTLTLTLDDSPEAADLLHTLRTSPHVRLLQEDAPPAGERVLPLLWPGNPDVSAEDIFGGEPIILRPLAEIRRDWDKRPPLKFPLPAAADDKDDDGNGSVCYERLHQRL